MSQRPPERRERGAVGGQPPNQDTPGWVRDDFYWIVERLEPLSDLFNPLPSRVEMLRLVWEIISLLLRMAWRLVHEVDEVD